MLSVGAYRRSQASSGHQKLNLSICNYYIKIGLAPAKPSGRTTLLFRDEMRNILSLGKTTKVLCPSQVVLSDRAQARVRALHADPLKIENIYNRRKSAQIKADKTNIMLRRVIVLQDRTPLPAYRV